MQSLKEQSDALVQQLVEVLRQMDASDPIILDEDGDPDGYESGNGRAVVEYTETICQTLLKTVHTDAHGGCILCRN